MNSVEVGNIPKDCWLSAVASLLALKRPRCWVMTPLDGLDGDRAVRFDLAKE